MFTLLPTSLKFVRTKQERTIGGYNLTQGIDVHRVALLFKLAWIRARPSSASTLCAACGVGILDPKSLSDGCCTPWASDFDSMTNAYRDVPMLYSRNIGQFCLCTGAFGMATAVQRDVCQKAEFTFGRKRYR